MNRLTPHATAILLLAANAPDIDIVSAFGGSLTYLRYHRYLTHAIVMAPVMALFCVLAVRLFTGLRGSWKMAFLAALAGVASHLALDFTNVYGIRLLLPFSARWLHLDMTSVVDPWIWAALALSVIAPAFARLVDHEIGAPKRGGRTSAICALAFLLFYDGGRALLHERALAVLDSRIYAGAAPRRVAAFPDAFNPLRWRGLAQGDGFYAVFDLDLRDNFDPTAGAVYFQARETQLIEQAASSAEFQDFLAFAQYPLWTVLSLAEPPAHWRIQLLDMRFGTPQHPGFTEIAVLDEQLRIIKSQFSFRGARLR